MDVDEVKRLATQELGRELQEAELESLLTYIKSAKIDILQFQSLLQELKEIMDDLMPISATVLNAIAIRQDTPRQGTIRHYLIQKIKSVYRKSPPPKPSLGLILVVIKENPHDNLRNLLAKIVSRMRRGF